MISLYTAQENHQGLSIITQLQNATIAYVQLSMDLYKELSSANIQLILDNC